MYEHTISPVALSLGPIHIRWYGIIFVTGIILSYHFVKYLARKRNIDYGKDWLSNVLFVVVLGSVVGARLGSVISDAGYYAANPLQIIAVWQGGLAFHGGVIGAVVAGLWYARKKKIDFLRVADLVAIPVALALGLGRVANFINGEFYGVPTDLPWGVIFPVDELARHPVQLYEALYHFVMFGVLWKLKDFKLAKGSLLWSFFVMYGLFRFFFEFLKDPASVSFPAYGFGLSWGQFWSIPLVIVGAYMLYRGRKSKDL